MYCKPPIVVQLGCGVTASLCSVAWLQHSGWSWNKGCMDLKM